MIYFLFGIIVGWLTLILIAIFFLNFKFNIDPATVENLMQENEAMRGYIDEINGILEKEEEYDGTEPKIIDFKTKDE